MLRPRPGLSWRLGAAIGLLTTLMAITIWLNFMASAALEKVREAITDTTAIIFANDDLFSLLQELESSQRGYLLTRRAAYLDPFNQSADKVAPALQKLRDVTAFFGEYRQPMAEINRLVPLKLREMSRSLELAASGDWDAVQGLVDSDIGKNSMATIRRVSDQIQDIAVDARGRAVDEAKEGQLRLQLTSVAISVLTLIAAVLAILNLVTVNRGLSNEVARRRQIEAGLREMEERNRAFFEHSGDYLYLVEQRDDGQWCYRQINPAMAKLIGKTDDEVRGRPIGDVVGNGPAAISIANFQRCQQSRAAVSYDNHATFGGETYDFNVSLIPLGSENGAVSRILGSARDTTHSKLTEAALRQSQKMEAVGQLTGGVAHDFNNLLQVVIGNLELAAKTAGDETVKKRLAAAMTAADLGRQLTRKLLTFARQSPSAAVVTEPGAVLRDLEPIIRASIGETVPAQMAIADDLWRIEVDRASLESAILNLVINARDAMPNGGALKVEIANVTVGEAFAASHADAHAGDHVRITVTDNGAGIPAALLGKVFVPFFTTKAAGMGTGLGLATVYSLVRERGGFADIQSREGHGTTVSLYFPRSDGLLTPAEAAGQVAAGGSELILVVEDDRQLLDTTVETLRGMGYKVEAAATVDIGLQAIAAGGNFDLLLTDVVMPGPFNGVALARRAQAIKPRLRILFMSGYIDDPAVRQAAASGNLQVLQKPFMADQLSAAVRAALDRSEGRRRRAGSTYAAGGRLDFRAADTGRNVLVVEDDALVRAVAIDALTMAGFRCIEAENAADALRCLEDEGVGIDAMITDLGLPDQPGEVVVEAAMRLRPGMPVIVSTGSGLPGEELPLRTRPGVSFLLKPYTPELLVRRINELTR